MNFLNERTKIFVAALYLYTLGIYYFTKMIGGMLYLVIKYIPDNMVPAKLFPIDTNKNFNILQAKTDQGQTITNKINLYLKTNTFIERITQKNIEPKDNTLNIEYIKNILGVSIIWIIYMLEPPKKSKNPEKNEITPENITQLLKIILIDFGKKIYFQMNNNGEYEQNNTIFGSVTI